VRWRPASRRPYQQGGNVGDVQASLLHAAMLCLHALRTSLYDRRSPGALCPKFTGVHQRVRGACGCNVRPPVSCVTFSRPDCVGAGHPSGAVSTATVSRTLMLLEGFEKCSVLKSATMGGPRECTKPSMCSASLAIAGTCDNDSRIERYRHHVAYWTRRWPRQSIEAEQRRGQCSCRGGLRTSLNGL